MDPISEIPSSSYTQMNGRADYETWISSYRDKVKYQNKSQPNTSLLGRAF